MSLRLSRNFMQRLALIFSIIKHSHDNRIRHFVIPIITKDQNFIPSSIFPFFFFPSNSLKPDCIFNSKRSLQFSPLLFLSISIFHYKARFNFDLYQRSGTYPCPVIFFGGRVRYYISKILNDIVFYIRFVRIFLRLHLVLNRGFPGGGERLGILVSYILSLKRSECLDIQYRGGQPFMLQSIFLTYEF